MHYYCGSSVGHSNYRWFLLFLISTLWVCAYGFYLIWHLFQFDIQRLKLMEMVYKNEEGIPVQVDYKTAHLVRR